MKKIILRSAATLLMIFGLSFLNSANAQSNSIEAVKVKSNDGFGELRKLVTSNFDFTNPNLSEGLVNSEVEFNVSNDGKITNIHAKGDCKYVSEELENVMNQLLYKVDVNKLNKNTLAATYVMPVKLLIDN